MLVVKIELWPGGDGSRAREIGRTLIWNSGENENPLRGDYQVRVCRRGNPTKVARKAAVKSWPRKSYNVWRLICRCLMAAFPEEAKRRGGRN